MKNKPHYGYYALAIVTKISAILMATGITAFIFISKILGIILAGFAIYTFAAYFISIRSLQQDKSLGLSHILRLKGDE